MTIRTATGETFDRRAEADERGVLWLIDAEGVRCQLAVVLQGGWRVMDTTPAERALLEAHAFGAGKRVLRWTAPDQWVAHADGGV